MRRAKLIQRDIDAKYNLQAIGGVQHEKSSDEEGESQEQVSKVAPAQSNTSRDSTAASDKQKLPPTPPKEVFFGIILQRVLILGHAGFDEMASGIGRMASCIEKLVDNEETHKRINDVEMRLGAMETSQLKMISILEEMNKKT